MNGTRSTCEMFKTNLINVVRSIDPNDEIPLFFSKKNIFITGGSGFMGKVLIEKLLRTCPGIEKIYILLREKRGLSLKQRLAQITENIIFDKCRQINAQLFDKIVVIPGDVREIDLGISSSDRQLLINVISIVYHVAATVRFDDTLADAIIMNTRGTREVCKLVLDLKHVDGFLHVSTAYSQHDKSVVEEVLYRAATNWREMIKIVENTDGYLIKTLSGKMMFGNPNTYVFSKALAENVVADMCEAKVPTIIFRPTIVVSILRDPLPGWVDNFNGPVGLIAASAKGILRTHYINYEAILDFIPVDVAINAMLKAVWIQKYLDPKQVAIYNCSSEGLVCVKSSTLQEIGFEVLEVVTPQVFWYPNFATTDNRFVHMCNIYLYHVLPAFLVDFILRCTNNKPLLMNIQRKIYIALNSLRYFVRHTWTFRNNKFLELDNYLAESDRARYCDDLRNVDVTEFFLRSAKVGYELILKEDLSDIDRNKRRLKIMEIVHKSVKFTTMIFFLIFAIHFICIPTIESVMNYIDSL